MTQNIDTHTGEVIENAERHAFNTAGEAISQGKTVQKMETSYATAVAVQRPRDIARIESNCLVEAAKAGEAMYYGWGAGEGRVEGPSIDLAMIAVRNWGNCALEMRPIQETLDGYIMEAAFIDLETGFTYSRQFRQGKRTKVSGRMDEERKADVRFQIGQSKAQRNCIIKALPSWLVDAMVNAAKANVLTKIQALVKAEGWDGARKITVKSLEKYGVKVENVVHKYGVPVEKWHEDELIRLKGDIAALGNGRESAQTLFPDPEPEEAKDGPARATVDLDEAVPGDPNDHQGYGDKPGPSTSKKTKTDNDQQIKAGF